MIREVLLRQNGWPACSRLRKVLLQKLAVAIDRVKITETKEISKRSRRRYRAPCAFVRPRGRQARPSKALFFFVALSKATSISVEVFLCSSEAVALVEWGREIGRGSRRAIAFVDGRRRLSSAWGIDCRLGKLTLQRPVHLEHAFVLRFND
jgi:hypothetical protein